MSKKYCCLCKMEHTDYNWLNMDWYGKGKSEWACSKHFVSQPHEYTTDSIREARKEYFKTQIQASRKGELSREFVEAYPKAAKQMVAEGHITQQDIKKAKYIWKDIPGWRNRDTSK